MALPTARDSYNRRAPPMKLPTLPHTTDDGVRSHRGCARARFTAARLAARVPAACVVAGGCLAGIL